MIFNVPGMIICTLLGWCWLQIIFVGVGSKSRIPNSSPETNARVKKLILKKYKELGDISFQEKAVLCVFILLVTLWLFREPGFIYGWVDLFKWIFGNEDLQIGNATPALFCAVLLFIIPVNPNFWPSAKYSDLPLECPSARCLNWQIVHEKIPWGIILLLGGGFAVAKASDESGLSLFLGEQLTGLQWLPVPISVSIICIMTTLATEVASNVATASIVMPILVELSLALCVNPLYFMVPAAVCCSYAFMLPVATAPNAIAFEASDMEMKDMVR
ncbi:UNVERIFIED_CONTAM: hypothetical protein GTU68_063239 [Idotea baltica]|nr:hypothetical protein [Idotea baltica]